MEKRENYNPKLEQLFNILDFMNEGVYVINADYEIVFANAAFIKEFGSIDKQKCYEYLCGRTAPCQWCKLDEVLAGQTVCWEWECSRTGKVYNCLDAPLTNPDGGTAKLKIIHNITEAKDIEQQLRDLSRFPEENPFPVLRILKDGTILYSNKPGMVLVEQWGRKVGQKVPADWADLIVHTLESQRYHVEEMRCAEKIFSVAVAPVAEDGYVNLYGRDVTPIRQSEAQLLTTLENLSEGVVVADVEGDIFHWNPAAMAMYGFSSLAECRRKLPDFAELFELSDTGGHVLSIEQWPLARVLRGETLRDVEIHVTWRQMDRRGVFNYSGTLARDKDGNPLMAIMSITDITNRKKAEQALHDSEARYRELIQNANSAIIRWSGNGKITFFNEYAQSFFGYREDEIIGQDVSILIPDFETSGTDLRALAQDVVDNPQRYTSNINENICRDGRRVWMSWTNRAIWDEQGRVTEIFAVGSDITERRQAEEELRKSYEDLKRFNSMAVDRELRMIELKQEINELCLQAGAPLRYAMDAQGEVSTPESGKDAAMEGFEDVS